jgi:hypothetical protein
MWKKNPPPDRKYLNTAILYWKKKASQWFITFPNKQDIFFLSILPLLLLLLPTFELVPPVIYTQNCAKNMKTEFKKKESHKILLSPKLGWTRGLSTPMTLWNTEPFRRRSVQHILKERPQIGKKTIKIRSWYKIVMASRWFFRNPHTHTQNSVFFFCFFFSVKYIIEMADKRSPTAVRVT